MTPDPTTTSTVNLVEENGFATDQANSHTIDTIDKGNTKKGPKERGNWGGQLEFILTCIGYAVGLGNVWRFPYLCYKNGGGAFLIPYVIMLLFVGLPLFFMELAFGQFASLGPISIWKINPLFKGMGWAMIIVTFCVSLYYNVIVAYCLYYLFASMTSVLPWSTCDNEWNSEYCTNDINDDVVKNVTYLNNATIEIENGTVTLYNCSASAIQNALATINTTTTTLVANCTEKQTAINSSTEEYFYNKVLGLTDDFSVTGKLKWELSLCLLLAWIIVFLVLIKGIQTLGKVVYFTALFPYVLLTALLIQGCTLEGSIDGILYYVTPQWDRLLDGKVWSDAATQIFYSLATCSGGLIAMASFNKFNNNCLRDALIVPFINCGTSIYAGFVIFSVLGFMAHEKHTTVADVARGGPGLAFIVYPEAVAKMPLFPPLWAMLFFIMMVMLGFSSLFSMMETVISAISDEYKRTLRTTTKRTIIFRAAICTLAFLLGLPMCLENGMYLLNLIDNFVGGFPLLIVGFLECIAINHIYGYKRFAADIRLMLGREPGEYFRATLCVVSPLVMIGTIVFKSWNYQRLTYNHYVYPDWAEALGWVTAAIPISVIFIWMLVQYCRSYGYQACIKANRPSSSWGPAMAEHRSDTIYEEDRQMETRSSVCKETEAKNGDLGHTNQSFSIDL
ncbi:sodium- and chloride-dependent glycine transporter 1-like isoform X1 [Tubulanus polymorphus]|uniref:sodium- and chloride-dependent glycine transporter 1-like isoform X1 n=1 Tax=Tubulanus polymorphus TaxID=672921 RepID=UPI003DA6A83D